MMLLPDFELLRPETVNEALDAIDEEHVPIFGGTELLLAMKVGMLRPEGLVDLRRLDALRHLGVEGHELVIGGGVTHAQVSASSEVRDHTGVLADVEHAVGNPRVRAQGTVGGNLCFAEPKSDVATALIALDATVVLQGPQGRRSEPVREFVQGPYTTSREDSELLIEVRVPRLTGSAVYRKFQTMERPTVGVAAATTADGVTLVVGAVGGLPVRVDFGSFDEVDVDQLVADLSPMGDLTGSEEYKRHVAEVEIHRALESLEAIA